MLKLLNAWLSFCNDLISHFEQQILLLEKQAEATDPTTDCHGHDGPSQGLISKHLENLKLGTENRLSELCDGMGGRTVTGVTDRHRLFREIESLNSVTGSRTDRRRRDGLLQTAKSQSGSDFFIRFKGRFLLFLP